MNKNLFTIKEMVFFWAIILLGTTMIVGITPREAFSPSFQRAAIPAVVGDNFYVAWWTNKTSNNNEEVMFRASTDGGQTFEDKINLSNTINSDSNRVEIDSDADSVVVTWWETNQTSETPVMRVSDDNGATFGPILTLAVNGTVGGAEEVEE
jgi:hypothetical protein